MCIGADDVGATRPNVSHAAMARFYTGASMSSRFAIPALAVAGALLAAPSALAGPEDGESAADVIADLEARGNIVVINRVGSGPMADCKATAVRPGRFLNPGTVVNTPGVAWGGILLQHRVVNVDITC
ncbi:hypothetical protein P5V47_07450 [Mycobacteroides abscessus subsp. massiliense]|uniref:hypothetical protein n=1 Tax=Mycobacteroides abscessus TaxID=36809 RepID=UPI00266CB8CC|nr:hypothetical protein [Mycobacteroides abscessus]MDO3298527.1 hypothetical protein [Mycobacteroides abscessus subsp. massiliense]